MRQASSLRKHLRLLDAWKTDDDDADRSESTAISERPGPDHSNTNAAAMLRPTPRLAFFSLSFGAKPKAMPDAPSHAPPSPQRSAPAAYYRGGTSRGLIFPLASLPSLPKDATPSTHPAAYERLWAPIFRGAINSPDPHGRQLDGLGGGISSLSKVCVVGAPSTLGAAVADVDFTFAAVGVRTPEVDFSASCGNLTAAIGPFAVDAGLVAPPVLEEYWGETPSGAAWGETVVRIHNTNTGKIIHARFAVVQGERENGGRGRRRWEAVAEGDFGIDGVAGTGARIRLDFVRPAGSKTGSLLPTGSVRNTFDGVEASCVDVGNPAVFVRAKDLLGSDAILKPEEIEQDQALLDRLDSIRRQAGVQMGLASKPQDVPGSIPKIGMVSSPATCTLQSGEVQQKDTVDVLVRALSVGQPHRAIPITMALAVAAAAKTKTSIVEEALAKGQAADPEGITIGHASGKIVVGATFGDDQQLESATVYRTTRRIMDGKVYWKS